VDVTTIALLAGIVSNPRLWGMPFIAATLLSWVVVQGARYLIGKSTRPLAAGVQIAITFWAVYTIGMTTDIALSSALMTLIFWIIAEIAWMVVGQVWFDKLKARPLNTESGHISVNDNELRDELGVNDISANAVPKDASAQLHRRNSQ